MYQLGVYDDLIWDPEVALLSPFGTPGIPHQHGFTVIVVAHGHYRVAALEFFVFGVGDWHDSRPTYRIRFETRIHSNSEDDRRAVCKTAFEVL